MRASQRRKKWVLGSAERTFVVIVNTLLCTVFAVPAVAFLTLFNKRFRGNVTQKPEDYLIVFGIALIAIPIYMLTVYVYNNQRLRDKFIETHIPKNNIVEKIPLYLMRDAFFRGRFYIWEGPDYSPKAIADAFILTVNKVTDRRGY